MPFWHTLAMSMDEPEEDGARAKPSGEWAIEGAATGLAAAILMTEPGPIGVAVATTLPFAAKVAHELDVRVWRHRVIRGGEALEVAAGELEISLEDLVAEAAQSDARTELLGRVIAAAASTVNLTTKIRALGVALANALRDEAKLDQAVDLVALMAVMEPPHLRALSSLYDRWEHDTDERDGWTTTEQIMTSTGQSVRNSAVMEALTSHGGVHQRTMALMEGGYAIASYSLSWRITDLGLDCLQLLGYEPVVKRPVGSRLPEDEFLK